ncbi:MAG: TM2 domain-containing protein [Phycisphaerae bacterium]
MPVADRSPLPDPRWNQPRDRAPLPAAFPPRSRVLAGLLGIFFGPFGVHRFYLGYNSIGTWQILATVFTGGVAGLWGFIEGLIILANGNMRDALGRPLEDGSPLLRSTLVRLIFGAGAVVCLVSSVVMFGLGTFGVELDERAAMSGQRVQFNPFHIAYIVGAGTLGLGAFMAWKSAHRPGFSLWRATIRPGAICAFVAVALAAVATNFFIAFGVEQELAMLVALLATLGLIVFWNLRGPDAALLPADVYWDGAYRKLFFFLGALSLLVSAAAVQNRHGRLPWVVVSRTASTDSHVTADDIVADANPAARAELRRFSRFDDERSAYLESLPAAGSQSVARLAPIALLVAFSCMLEGRYRGRRLRQARALFVTPEFRA